MLALSVSVELEHVKDHPGFEIDAAAFAVLSRTLDDAADMAERCNTMMEEEVRGD